MNQLVLASSTAAELSSCNQRTELLDESGVRIGFFEPVPKLDAQLYAQANALFEDAELRRRQRETGAQTTTEVWTALSASQPGGPQQASRA